MKKSDAIAGINAHYGTRVMDASTAHFANVNTRKPVWWLDVPLSKIEQGEHEDLHLLLAHPDSRVVHHLRVPMQFLRENRPGLVVRHEKHCISLELSSLRSQRFADVRLTGRGVGFAEFLQCSVSVP